MTTVEIVLLSIFAVVFVLILFLFIQSYVKNKTKSKKDAKVKQTNIDKSPNDTGKELKEKVLEVKPENTLNKAPTVAVVVENVQDTGQEQQPVMAEQTKVDTKTQSITNEKSQKPISQQIDELSPELKSILFTDILKPKY